MYHWKNYICEPSNIRIEINDAVYNHLIFYIYREETAIYTRDYEYNGELKQENLDRLVVLLCNIFTKTKIVDDSFTFSTAAELEKVWNKGGLLIWQRSK